MIGKTIYIKQRSIAHNGTASYHVKVEKVLLDGIKASSFRMVETAGKSFKGEERDGGFFPFDDLIILMPL